MRSNTDEYIKKKGINFTTSINSKDDDTVRSDDTIFYLVLKKSFRSYMYSKD